MRSPISAYLRYVALLTLDSDAGLKVDALFFKTRNEMGYRLLSRATMTGLAVYGDVAIFTAIRFNPVAFAKPSPTRWDRVFRGRVASRHR